MKKDRKTAAAMLLIPAVLFLAAGCSNVNMNDTDNEDHQVAGAEAQVIYGNIAEINSQARTVLVERFELTSTRSGEMTDDTVNGYRIENRGSRMLYPLAENVSIELSNTDYSTNPQYMRQFGGDNKKVFSNDRENSGLGSDEDTADAAVERMSRVRNTALQEGIEGMDDINNNTDIFDLNKDGNTMPETQKNSVPSHRLTDGATRLTERIGKYEHIPFRLTLENGKVVRITEMSELYV